MDILLICPSGEDYAWIKDCLGEHEVTLVHTEQDASQKMYDIDSGRLLCDLIILCEFYIAVMTIDQLIALGQPMYEWIDDAKGSGLRLCKLAQTLGLKPKLYATSTLAGEPERQILLEAQAAGAHYVDSADFRDVMRDVCRLKGR